MNSEHDFDRIIQVRASVIRDGEARIKEFEAALREIADLEPEDPIITDDDFDYGEAQAYRHCAEIARKALEK